VAYDHPVLNTSFQHTVHHAVTSHGRDYHTGFLLKLWDDLAGTKYLGHAVVPAKLNERTAEE
jgi:hypothetical protein